GTVVPEGPACPAWRAVAGSGRALVSSRCPTAPPVRIPSKAPAAVMAPLPWLKDAPSSPPAAPAPAPPSSVAGPTDASAGGAYTPGRDGGAQLVHAKATRALPRTSRRSRLGVAEPGVIGRLLCCGRPRQHARVLGFGASAIADRRHDR